MENKINCRILFLKGRELCCYYYSYTLVAYCNNPCWILWPYRKALCHHLCYKSSCLVINHGIHQPIRTSRAESDWLRRMEVLVSCGGETCLNARLAFEWHRGQFGLKWCFFLYPPVTPSLVCVPLGLILQFIILLPSKIEWDGDETMSERYRMREWREIVLWLNMHMSIPRISDSVDWGRNYFTAWRSNLRSFCWLKKAAINLVSVFILFCPIMHVSMWLHFIFSGARPLRGLVYSV